MENGITSNTGLFYPFPLKSFHFKNTLTWSSFYSKLWSFGWGTKVYVQKRSGPSSSILHQFCLTKGSTLTSQDYSPASVVYVSKLIGPSGGIYNLHKRKRMLWLHPNTYSNSKFSSKLSRQVKKLLMLNWGIFIDRSIYEKPISH